MLPSEGRAHPSRIRSDVSTCSAAHVSLAAPCVSSLHNCLPLPVSPCCSLLLPVCHCSEGGTSIEDLAEKFPDKIIKIPVDIRQGVCVWGGVN